MLVSNQILILLSLFSRGSKLVEIETFVQHKIAKKNLNNIFFFIQYFDIYQVLVVSCIFPCKYANTCRCRLLPIIHILSF